jgi:cbb3-type cytochrome oxidase cytochrome c subunit
MFESKTGVFLIAGLGSFALAFVSNAVLPILMYRHLPEKTVEETVNYRVMTHFADLHERYPAQFEKHANLKPNQPVTVELASQLLREGRKIYIGEGCFHCHSQFVRPVSNETRRFGPVSKSWEYQNELQRPVLFGTRRVGPDLIRESNKRSNDWHAVHFFRPRDTSPGSVMPEYPWFYDENTSAKPNRRGLAIILYMQWLGAEMEATDRSGDQMRTTLDFSGSLR